MISQTAQSQVAASTNSIKLENLVYNATKPADWSELHHEHRTNRAQYQVSQENHYLQSPQSPQVHQESHNSPQIKRERIEYEYDTPKFWNSTSLSMEEIGEDPIKAKTDSEIHNNSEKLSELLTFEMEEMLTFDEWPIRDEELLIFEL